MGKKCLDHEGSEGRGQWVVLYWKPVASRVWCCLTSFSVTFEEDAGDAKEGHWKCWRTELPFKGIWTGWRNGLTGSL